MALTEKQIDDLVAEILSGSQERMLEELTESAISRFERAMEGLGGTQVAEAQLEQLARLWPDEAREILAKYSSEISEEAQGCIYSLLTEAAAVDAAAVMAYKGIKGKPTTDVFKRNAKQAAKGVSDIIRRQNILMEATAEKVWYSVCADAVSAAVVGTMPQSEIIAKGVAKMADIGCTHVTYGRNGQKTVSNFVDVAIRRHVRTQVAQAGARITTTLLDSYGHDLVITDAHFGARPEHAEWQGKPCCMKGSKKVDGVEYPDIRDLTGYGTVTGLLGANCAHQINPYYPGITPIPDRDFEKLQKHYGMTSDEYYAATQKQRAWERRIRQTKREIAAMESAGIGLESPTYVQKRLVLGRQQASVAKLCKESKLARRPDLEYAYGIAKQPRALKTAKSFDYSKAKAPSVIRMHSMDTFASNYAASPVERGMVFDKNGNDLMRRAVKGARDHVDIPLPDGFKDWHTLHVAHTHPDGGTLSMKDIRSFNEVRPLSTSVVADGGIYTLAPAKGSRNRWVDFLKGYENAFVDTKNDLEDALERACIARGTPATYAERVTLDRNLAIAMDSWMKDNAGRYGMAYGFSPLK